MNKVEIKIVFISFILIASIFTISGYTISKIKIQSTVSASSLTQVNYVISYPTSYTLDINVQEWKEWTDNNQGFYINFPSRLKVYKQNEYFGKSLQKNVTSIIDDKNPDDSRFDLKIIPFTVDSKKSALSILETYIVSYVGIVPKNNQKTFIKNNFEVAQIGYNPSFADGSNYFRVYTLLKKGNNVWVFTIGYFTDISKTDSLVVQNSYEYSIYSKIMDSFVLKDSVKDETNTMDITKINKDWINQYHNFNSSFQTNI